MQVESKALAKNPSHVWITREEFKSSPGHKGRICVKTKSLDMDASQVRIVEKNPSRGPVT